MRPSWEWEEPDIQLLIDNKVSESLTLDYKSCDSLQKTEGKKREVGKDVSAFANSAGGTIVYGVIEETQVPLRLDVGYDPADISAEWIDQVINSNIQRKIDGVRIKQVRLDNSHPGRVLYVVDIPQSTRAPHMASDHKFYKRYEFQSVPMEEYEVRDVGQRGEIPDLHCKFTLGETLNGPLLTVPLKLSATELRDGRPILEPVGLTVTISNEAAKPAEYAYVVLLIDSRLGIANWGGLWGGRDVLAVSEQGSSKMTKVVKHWSVHAEDLPLWQGLPLPITNSLAVRPPGGLESPGTYLLGWEVRYPGMETKRGWCMLKVVTNYGWSTVSLVEDERELVEYAGPGLMVQTVAQ